MERYEQRLLVLPPQIECSAVLDVGVRKKRKRIKIRLLKTKLKVKRMQRFD